MVEYLAVFWLQIVSLQYKVSIWPYLYWHSPIPHSGSIATDSQKIQPFMIPIAYLLTTLSPFLPYFILDHDLH